MRTLLLKRSQAWGIDGISMKKMNHRRRARIVARALEPLESRLLLSALSWSTGPSMPAALGRTVALDLGVGVLVTGGSTTAAGNSTPTTSRLFDYQDNVWTTAPSIDQGRNGAAIGYTNTGIFIYGGSEQGQPTASVLNYNFSTGDSDTGPAMLTARYDFAAATDSGALYAIGGLNASNHAISNAERYDPTVGAWAAIAPLPVALAKASAASDGAGHILIFGGVTSTGAPTNTVYAYSIAANTWSTMATMPLAASGTAAVFGAYGQIYVIGGQTSTGASSAVNIFNPITNQWTSETPLPTAEFGASAVLDSNNNLDIIGGFNSAGTAVASVYTAAALPAPTGLPVVPTLQFNGTWYTYDGQPHQATATALATDGVTPINGSVTLTYNGSSTLPIAAGTYNILATFISADPGYINTQVQSQLYIQQATPALILTGGGTIPYDGQPHGITATTLGVDNATPVSGTTTYTYNGAAAIPLNPGTYAAVITFTSADPNYTNATASATITIPDPTIPTGVTVSGASLTSVRVSWNAVPGAASYEVWERHVLHSPKGSGSTITYSVVATTINLSAVINVSSGTFYVSSVSPAGIVSPRSAAASGSALSPPSFYSMLWGGAVTSYASIQVGQTLHVTLLGYGNEPPVYTMLSGPSTMSVDPATGIVTYTPVASEAGTNTATFKATNSVGTGTATFSFHVLALPTVVVTGGSFPYDGNTHAASAIAYATDGITPIAGTFTFLYSPAAYPTAMSTSPYAEPGTYIVHATFTSTDPNYGGATGTGSLTILPDPWAGTPVLNIAAGTTTTWTTGSRIDSISVAAGGQLNLQSPDTIETQSLTLAPGSLLDLSAHDFIIHNASLADITSDLITGRLISSAGNASNGLIGLGAVDGATYAAINGSPTFGGLPVAPTDVLVRLTYRGDANLNGIIDNADYLQIDFGYLLGASGYANGDFNNDGAINAADYAIINANLQLQSGPLAAGTALAPAASPSVSLQPAASAPSIASAPEVASAALITTSTSPGLPAHAVAFNFLPPLSTRFWDSPDISNDFHNAISLQPPVTDAQSDHPATHSAKRRIL